MPSVEEPFTSALDESLGYHERERRRVGRAIVQATQAASRWRRRARYHLMALVALGTPLVLGLAQPWRGMPSGSVRDDAPVFSAWKSQRDFYRLLARLEAAGLLAPASSDAAELAFDDEVLPDLSEDGGPTDDLWSELIEPALDEGSEPTGLPGVVVEPGRNAPRYSYYFACAAAPIECPEEPWQPSPPELPDERTYYSGLLANVAFEQYDCDSLMKLGQQAPTAVSREGVFDMAAICYRARGQWERFLDAANLTVCSKPNADPSDVGSTVQAMNYLGNELLRSPIDQRRGLAMLQKSRVQGRCQLDSLRLLVERHGNEAAESEYLADEHHDAAITAAEVLGERAMSSSLYELGIRYAAPWPDKVLRLHANELENVAVGGHQSEAYVSNLMRSICQNDTAVYRFRIIAGAMMAVYFAEKGRYRIAAEVVNRLIVADKRTEYDMGTYLVNVSIRTLEERSREGRPSSEASAEVLRSLTDESKTIRSSRLRAVEHSLLRWSMSQGDHASADIDWKGAEACGL